MILGRALLSPCDISLLLAPILPAGAKSKGCKGLWLPAPSIEGRNDGLHCGPRHRGWVFYDGKVRRLVGRVCLYGAKHEAMFGGVEFSVW